MEGGRELAYFGKKGTHKLCLIRRIDLPTPQLTSGVHTQVLVGTVVMPLHCVAC